MSPLIHYARADPAPATQAQPSDITIGGIPLAAFIVMCLFAPFTLSTFIFVIWHWGIKPCQRRKRVEEEERTAEENRLLADQQIKGFIGDLQPPPKVDMRDEQVGMGE